MSRSDEYKNRLRSIVLHSADVLPDEIAAYLKKAATEKSGYWWEVRNLVFEQYQPLVASIPKEFVNFMLDSLIKQREEEPSGSNEEILELNDLRLPTAEQTDASNPNEDIGELSKDALKLEAQSSNQDVEPLENPISNNKNLPTFPSAIPAYEDPTEFGIEEYLDFCFPPSPIQGPFFNLLIKEEDEGLRLVKTLCKVAVEKWRQQKQCQELEEPGYTPLPITLNLPSGAQEFWGDAQIYRWYRGTSVGPYPLISALMALEMWMERQIEADRNVEDLFEKVLKESNCVVFLGICVSIALAYPQKCLSVVLPIVSSPALWQMDIERQVHETIMSWGLLQEWSSQKDRFLYEINEERNKKHQRSLEVRSLAMYYILSADNSLRSEFEQAVAKFTENLPFRYQEEQNNPDMIAYLREQMENYQVFGKWENYRYRRVEDRVEVIVELPEQIRKRDEEQIRKRDESEQGFNSEWQRWVNLYLWAELTIKDGRTQERITLEEAVVAAKELQTSEDFAETDKENIRNFSRLQAIAGVAAAILITDFEWVRTQNHLEWSRAILLAAARMAKASMSPFSISIKFYTARGLALLATHGVADIEVRQQILQLISESLRRFSDTREVVKEVFIVLKNAWNIDPVLCWNALSLCLSLSVIPGQLYYKTHIGEFDTSCEEQKTWEDNVIQNHFDYLAKGEIPELSRIPTARNIVFVHEQFKYGLYALPLTELCRNLDTKDKLLRLCDDLVARTVADNLPVERKPYSQSPKPYEWNSFIFDWMACLAKMLSVEETRQHILTPLRDNWSQVPELTADLLNGYISHQIAYAEGPTAQALEIWKEISNWVLDSSEIATKVSYDYLDIDTGKVLQLIVFTQHGSSRIKDDWQHAHLFIDIFDKWVSVAGHNSYAYSHFLTMLNGIGWQFAPKRTLEWLNRCTNNAAHDFWNEPRGNGTRTAELLNRIWNNFERQIRSDKVSLQRYSNLVYRLVEAGIPLASVLQHKLEGRE
jgi:hypothetical protein